MAPFFWFWEFRVVELFDRTKVFIFFLGGGRIFQRSIIQKKQQLVRVRFALESARADLYSADPGEVFIFS